jgi:hypothetical protein
VDADTLAAEVLMAAELMLVAGPMPADRLMAAEQLAVTLVAHPADIAAAQLVAQSAAVEASTVVVVVAAAAAVVVVTGNPAARAIQAR